MNDLQSQVTSDESLIKKIEKLKDELSAASSVKITMHSGLTYTGNVCGQHFGRGGSEATGRPKTSWAGGRIVVETNLGRVPLDLLDIKSWSPQT